MNTGQTALKHGIPLFAVDYGSWGEHNEGNLALIQAGAIAIRKSKSTGQANAAHLTIDSHIDGWTPYKDLPVVLPEWGHHLVMDVNAAASGWFAWQWHKAKRLFRDDDPHPTRVDAKLLPALK